MRCQILLKLPEIKIDGIGKLSILNPDVFQQLPLIKNAYTHTHTHKLRTESQVVSPGSGQSNKGHNFSTFPVSFQCST